MDLVYRVIISGIAGVSGTSLSRLDMYPVCLSVVVHTAFFTKLRRSVNNLLSLHPLYLCSSLLLSIRILVIL